MAFSADWPGAFIRGDNAWAFKMALRHVLDHVRASETPDHLVLDVEYLEGLWKILDSSDAQCQDRVIPIQQLAEFGACLRAKPAV